MLINASSSRMNLLNGVTLPSSSRMNLFNGVTLRSSSHLCKSTHGVNLNNRVLPIQCLKQGRGFKLMMKQFQIVSLMTTTVDDETTNAVSDADFYEHFETWCKKYDKTYSSEEDKRSRFKLFKDNYPINPPDKKYLSLHFLDENAADDHPNGSSLRTYGLDGCSNYERDFSPYQHGAMYLHKIGSRQPFIVPLDSDMGKVLDDDVFYERYVINGTKLNTWKTKVTESMTILNFPRSISKRFLTHNPCYIKVIDLESSVHFPCSVKSSGKDVHEQFICKGWDDFLSVRGLKEGDS